MAAKREIFRKSALERMASLDQLDQTMTVVKPSTVLALISVGIMMTVAVLWGIFGSVPEVIHGSGVIMNVDKIESIKYTNQGTLKNIFISRGDRVYNGQVIARVERQDILDQIKLNEKKLEGLYKMQEIINEGSANSSSRRQTMRELYAQGLITESEFLNSQQPKINIEQQITEVREEIAVLNENYQITTQVVANCSGTVMEIPIRQGDFVQQGTTIAIIDTAGDENPIEALVYFSGADGKKLVPGMKIGLIPGTIKQEEYGYIMGIVMDVSEFPVSDNYLVSRLQNMALANTFHQIMNPIEARVSIVPDPSTYSGYKWSSSKGPEQKIGSGFICEATVTTETHRPISLLIPSLKKKLLGIGEDYIPKPKKQE